MRAVVLTIPAHDGMEDKVGEWLGVSIAIVSSCLGGTAAAITRYLVSDADPIALAILRWGIGFLCVLPAAFLLKVRWPERRDVPWVMLLGFCFFGLFFVFYNIAMSYTTAARASLALATLPLSTMVVGALLGYETLTARKTTGVCIAVFGVVAALAAGLSVAPVGAWRGEAIMLGAEKLRHRAMDRRDLSRGRRRRDRLHPVGAGAAAGDPDKSGQHHDRQSDRRGVARNATGRRAHYTEPGGWPRRGLCRHLDRYDRGPEGVAGRPQAGRPFSIGPKP